MHGSWLTRKRPAWDLSRAAARDQRHTRSAQNATIPLLKPAQGEPRAPWARRAGNTPGRRARSRPTRGPAGAGPRSRRRRGQRAAQRPPPRARDVAPPRAARPVGRVRAATPRRCARIRLHQSRVLPGFQHLALAVQRLRGRRVRQERHARRRRAAARASAFTSVGFLQGIQHTLERCAASGRRQQQRGMQTGPPGVLRRHDGPRRGEAHGGTSGLPPPPPPDAPPCAEASGVDASSMPASSSAAISSNSVRFSTLLCA